MSAVEHARLLTDLIIVSRWSGVPVQQLVEFLPLTPAQRRKAAATYSMIARSLMNA